MNDDMEMNMLDMIISNSMLIYMLENYDTLYQGLCDELDNCNYFGEYGQTETTR